MLAMLDFVRWYFEAELPCMHSRGCLTTRDEDRPRSSDCSVAQGQDGRLAVVVTVLERRSEGLAIAIVPREECARALGRVRRNLIRVHWVSVFALEDATSLNRARSGKSNVAKEAVLASRRRTTRLFVAVDGD